MSSFGLLLAGIGLVGAAFGFFALRLLVANAPAVLIAITYCIAVGWRGDDYDIGRGGQILIAGFLALLFVGVWMAGALIGSIARGRRVTRGSRGAPARPGTGPHAPSRR